MLMSTFEYKTLFGDKNPNEISAVEIEEKRKEYFNTISQSNKSNNFTTFKKPGIIIDDNGETVIKIAEYTGFEMDNWFWLKNML